MKLSVSTKRFLAALGMVGLMAGDLANAGEEELEGKGVIDGKNVIDHEEEEFPEENLWIYTKGTGVREKGTFEFKVEDIARLGKNSGDYEFHDIRPELEYGITDRWTVGGELMFFHHDYNNVEWAPMVDTQGGPGGSFKDTQIGGFELTTKYEILRPQDEWIGVAVAMSYEHRYAYRLDGADISQDSLVPQLFLQKSFMDNRLQWALKAKLEFEQRKSPGVLEEEIAPDISTGLSYELKDGLWVGFEARWQSDFLSPEEDGHVEGKPSNWDWGHWALGDQFQHGLYVGPTVHWNPEEVDWWVTGGAMFQVNGWSADGLDAANEGKNWDEHERVHIGILVGYEFGD